MQRGLPSLRRKLSLLPSRKKRHTEAGDLVALVAGVAVRLQAAAQEANRLKEEFRMSEQLIPYH
jgi:hypothetical protein